MNDNWFHKVFTDVIDLNTAKNCFLNEWYSFKVNTKQNHSILFKIKKHENFILKIFYQLLKVN